MTDVPAPARKVPPIADFRSDTLTRPTQAMREAMRDAEVGDDVFSEDPTVRRLEDEVAALFGRDAALFVPSGSQGNQIAARLHARSGEEVAVGEASHSLDWEMAALASLSGLQARTLPTRRGMIDPGAVAEQLREAGGFRPACRLLMVENTHNFHGGAVVPLSHLQSLFAVAREQGARVHLDGARLWNAAVATGTPLDAYGRIADSLMVCLSKGLCAPVGSMLIGDRGWIRQARDVRKLFGGGMRQVGVLAAPGLVAIRDMRDRLSEDHTRAKRLADGLEALGAELPFGPVDTNIVLVRWKGRDAKDVQSRLEIRGVRAIAVGADRLRFVTHHDVDDAGVDQALQACAEIAAA